MSEHWGGYDPGDGPLRDDIDDLTKTLAERDAEIDRLRDKVCLITEQAASYSADIERLRGLLRDYIAIMSGSSYQTRDEWLRRVREALGE